MKSKLSILFLVLIFSSKLFSSQARILSLGADELDNDGSYYFDDERNIFYNAANVNWYGDMVIFEMGDEGLQIGINETYINEEKNPKGQGGFLFKTGNLTWGAYLNNVSNTAVLLRVLASSTALASNGIDLSTAIPQVIPSSMLLPGAANQIEVFFGWGDQLKWGANLLFYNSSSDTPGTAFDSKGAAVRLGVKKQRWEAFANISLMNEVTKIDTATIDWGGAPISEQVQHSFDGSLGFQVGGSYKFESLKLYAYVKSFSWDQTDDYDYTTDPLQLRFDHGIPGHTYPSIDGGQTGTVSGSLNIFKLGIGNFIERDPKATFYWDIFARYYDVKVSFEKEAKVNAFELPLTFGIESKATDWLVIRGSVIHKLVGWAENKNYASLNPVAQVLATGLFGADNDGNSSSLPNPTSVRVGGSLVFGGLSIDGLMGANGALVDFSEFFYRAAIVYKW